MSSLAPRVAGTVVTRQVTPMLSTSKIEQRRKVLNLYRSWYRQMPHLLMDYDVPVDVHQCRAKLRAIFMANRNVTDMRAIDFIIAKGQMELRETIEIWKQKTHFMAYFRDTVPKTKTDFMSKFLDNNAPLSMNGDYKHLLPAFRALHKHTRMTRFCMALIDLSGTLHVEDQAVAGAVAAIDRLRQTGIPLRFVTNTTKESKRMLHQKLVAMGFHIALDEIFTSLTAARKILEAKKWRPWLLISDEALEDFDGLPCHDPNAVVIGLAPEKLSYENMNRAFDMISNEGAHLVAVHKSRYYQTKHGLALGPGAFVTGLEYATDTKAQVVGKPDAAFFLSAIPGSLCTHKLNEIVMIGDDVRDDVQGALKAGLSAILVKTGKYKAGDENKIEPQPTYVAEDIVQAVQYILEDV